MIDTYSIDPQCTNANLCGACIMRPHQVLLYGWCCRDLCKEICIHVSYRWMLVYTHVQKYAHTCKCTSTKKWSQIFGWTQSFLKALYPFQPRKRCGEWKQKEKAHIKPPEIIIKRSKRAINAFQWHIMIDSVCCRNLFPAGLWPLDQPYIIHINKDSCASSRQHTCHICTCRFNLARLWGICCWFHTLSPHTSSFHSD